MQPMRLGEIVGGLPPESQRRLVSIWVRPGDDGGWEARLTYRDSRPSEGYVHQPVNAGHWLDLPLEGAEPALREQIAELEARGTLGRLAVTPRPGASGGACLLQHPGWIIRVTPDL